MSKSAYSKKLQLEELALFSDLSIGQGIDIASRVIRISEDIEEGHFNWFDAAMNIMEKFNPRKTIVVKIHTYGGDLYSALGIIARMKESSCRIHTKGYGKMMSAGALMLAAGDKRSMSKISTLMHHEPSYGVEGRHSEVANHVRQAQTESDRWASLMCEFTGTDKQFWKRLGYNGKDLYINADEALRLHVVDEVF